MPPAPEQTEGKSRLPLLLAVVAVLGGLVMWDRLSGSPAPEVTAARAPPVAREGATRAPEQGVEPLANLALERLRETVDRPLFERSRRPAVPPVVQPTKTPPPPPPRGPDPKALELVGILAGDENSIALLKRRATGQQVRAQVGDTIDGWTIADIEPQRVILRHGADEVSLQLFQTPRR